MDIKINEKLIKYNYSSRNGTSIKYIVIHDTDNKDPGANAENHYRYFNSGDRQASAHYFIDDTQILRVVKDNNKSWHCGDGKGKNGITNANSIGIEMCVNSDGDFNITYVKTIDLTRYLMDKYNIPLDRVVRHYDASGKICPDIFSENSWAKWKQFIIDVEDYKQVDYTRFLTELYENNLKREPDSGGIKYWNDKLNEGYTYGDVLKSMGDSEEFKKVYGID